MFFVKLYKSCTFRTTVSVYKRACSIQSVNAIIFFLVLIALQYKTPDDELGKTVFSSSK